MLPNTRYKVLVPSPWKNERTGDSGNFWTEVGHAYMNHAGDGMTVTIRGNISVTGNLVIKLDTGTPADPAPATRGRKSPTANQPFPPSGLDDDDIPF